MSTSILQLVVLIVLSGVTALLASRRRDHVGVMVLGVLSSMIIAGLTIWERAQRTGTPFAIQEPLWFTLLARLVPVAAVLTSVSFGARRAWPEAVQVLCGVAVGIASNLLVIVALYLGLLLV